MKSTQNVAIFVRKTAIIPTKTLKTVPTIALRVVIVGKGIREKKTAFVSKRVNAKKCQNVRQMKTSLIVGPIVASGA